jgi:hypothetical protein
MGAFSWVAGLGPGRKHGPRLKVKIATALNVAAMLYLVIGGIHAIVLPLTVSGSDCVSATGLVGIYCYTKAGISHLVIALAWPFYWL